MKLLSILITIVIIGLIAFGYMRISSKNARKVLQESGAEVEATSGYIPAMVDVKKNAEQNLKNSMQIENERLQKDLEVLE